MIRANIETRSEPPEASLRPNVCAPSFSGCQGRNHGSSQKRPITTIKKSFDSNQGSGYPIWSIDLPSSVGLLLKPPAGMATASTRDRLIEAARKLFLAKGYEGTGVAEILSAAGVKSGSLYYFFKNKEELLLAVLTRYVELLHPVVIDPVFERVKDPIERIFAVLDGYREMLILTGCTQGCPIGNLALEMSEKSEAVRERIALNFENWRKVIHQCLIDAGIRLPDNLDRAKLSTFILAVMEGGVMQARAHRSPEPFDASVAVLRDYFDRQLLQNEDSIGQIGGKT